MKKKRSCFLAVFCIFLGGIIPAQDFVFADNALNVSIGGEVSATMLGYIEDISEGPDHMRLGDLFSGKLNFSARCSFGEAVINLNLTPAQSPVSFDEAYLQAYFGNFDIAAGLRKLTWGKADILGPLDVINPLNASEIYTIMADQSSLMSVKIARPLVHASYRFGQFSRIEGVFVPNFLPHSFAQTGRWADSRAELLALGESSGGVNEPDTSTLDFAQGGLRFTSTAGSSDIGLQYYYGRLPQPSVGLAFSPPSPVPQVNVLYNPYHQIGLDYAQVLFGFNTRAELAANITGDLDGDDGSVYNPFLAWSLGFDRDLFLGINLNIQADQNIRLRHDRIGSDNFMSGNFDIEGGLPLTSTRLTATLSRRFIRDELELRASAVAGIEDSDFIIMPALIWTKNAIRIAFSGGIFGGDSDGLLGQYRDNHFLKASMTYTF
jgi:hypothetical protein